MTKAQRLLRENPSEEFESAFFRAVGMFDYEMVIEPEKTYTVSEIHDLFVYLYEMRQHRNHAETPGAATPRESR